MPASRAAQPVAVAVGRSLASPCITAGLTLGGPAADGAGYVTFALTNAGTARYTLSGYPDVSVVDSNYAVIAGGSAEDPSLVPSGASTGTLTSPVQGSVHSKWAASSPRAGYSVNRGPAVRVYPPDRHYPLLQYGNSPACNLRVSPVCTPGRHRARNPCPPRTP